MLLINFNVVIARYSHQRHTTRLCTVIKAFEEFRLWTEHVIRNFYCPEHISIQRNERKCGRKISSNNPMNFSKRYPNVPYLVVFGSIELSTTLFGHTVIFTVNSKNQHAAHISLALSNFCLYKYTSSVVNFMFCCPC
jgi:hypothetical protein